MTRFECGTTPRRGAKVAYSVQLTNRYYYFANTLQDGDSTTTESRWSCKPSLGPSGSVCSIAYTLSEPLNFQTLHIGEVGYMLGSMHFLS